MGNSHGHEEGHDVSSASAEERAERYHLSVEEIETITAVFQDHNKEGKPIKLKQFKKLLAIVNEKHKNEVFFSPEAADLVFKVIDADGGGRIDVDEFIVGIRTFVAGSVEDKAKLVFRAIDKDNSGKVSQKEFKAYAQRCLQIWKKHYVSAQKVCCPFLFSCWFRFSLVC